MATLPFSCEFLPALVNSMSTLVQLPLWFAAGKTPTIKTTPSWSPRCQQSTRTHQLCWHHHVGSWQSNFIHQIFVVATALILFLSLASLLRRDWLPRSTPLRSAELLSRCWLPSWLHSLSSTPPFLAADPLILSHFLASRRLDSVDHHLHHTPCLHFPAMGIGNSSGLITSICVQPCLCPVRIRST